jgi:hypothetical protein
VTGNVGDFAGQIPGSLPVDIHMRVFTRQIYAAYTANLALYSDPLDLAGLLRPVTRQGGFWHAFTSAYLGRLSSVLLIVSPRIRYFNTPVSFGSQEDGGKARLHL